jgi:hypothetical protein
MEQEIYNDRLIDYLLGELTEEAQIQLEAEFFTDESSFDYLLATEEELIHDYLNGDLSEQKCSRFQNYFLSTPERIGRVQFHRELLAVIARKEEAHELRPVYRGLSQVLPFLKLPGAKPALMLPAACAIAVLLLGSLWLYTDHTRLRTQMDEMQTRLTLLQEQREVLNQQIAEQRAHSQKLLEQTQHNLSERKRLEKELAAIRQSQGAIVSFTLAPAQSRGLSTKAAKIRLSSNLRLLQLKLRVDSEANYKAYRAVLQKHGREILTINELRAGSSTSLKVINLSLPSTVFNAGDYVVTVFGITNSDNSEEQGKYLFKVVKK